MDEVGTLRLLATPWNFNDAAKAPSLIISAINALMKLSIESKKPIGNGILTCINMKQALDRSNRKGNKRKGQEAAKATLSILGIT